MRLFLTILPTIVLFTVQIVQAQELDSLKAIGKALANQVEYYINSEQADSIYSLGDEDFKSQIGKEEFNNFISQLYTLGRIESMEFIDLKDRIYRSSLDFKEQSFSLSLGVNQDLTFNTFLIEPYEKPQKMRTDSVISKVEKTDPLDDFVDSISRRYIQQENAQTLSIGILDRKGAKRYFYGETLRGNDSLPDENTIYEIGSLTKIFTAVLLADMVKKGTLSLEDKITEYLPDSVAQNPALKDITLLSLANHTSTLPRLPDNLEQSEGYSSDDPYSNYDEGDLYAFLKNFKGKGIVNETYLYSNLGFGLLGIILEKASDKTFGELVKDIITGPLQMTSTGVLQEFEDEDLMPVYNKSGKAVKRWSFKSMAPAGGLQSSLYDLLVFSKANLIRPETPLEEALTLSRELTYFNPPNDDVALAWHIKMTGGVISYVHSGGTAGSSSYIILIPDLDQAVVILANSSLPIDDLAGSLIENLTEGVGF